METDLIREIHARLEGERERAQGSLWNWVKGHSECWWDSASHSFSHTVLLHSTTGKLTLKGRWSGWSGWFCAVWIRAVPSLVVQAQKSTTALNQEPSFTVEGDRLANVDAMLVGMQVRWQLARDDTRRSRIWRQRYKVSAFKKHCC